MPNQRLEYLFDRQFSRVISREEREELMNLIDDPSVDVDLQDLIARRIDQSNTLSEDTLLPEESSRMILAAILEMSAPAKRPVISLFSFPSYGRIFKIAAAAVVIGLTGAIVWLTLYHSKSRSTIDVPTASHNINPGGNTAVLTLGDGSRIRLDSAHIGKLASQGAVSVVKLANGQLTYTKPAREDKTTTVVYNTMSTPRGGQYQLTLSDGTRVWLDAASSITYPTAFIGNERKIEVTGQVYVEVTHRQNQPFTVMAAGLEIRDLGTAFNINTYNDEPAARITLVEGRIVIRKNKQSILLKPGQQARSVGEERLSLLSNADLEQTLAWKNSLIKLGGAGIGEIMRQVSRWYDVDIRYEGNLDDAVFSGVVSRRQNAEELLKIIALTGSVQFSVDGKTITVKPGAHVIK